MSTTPELDNGQVWVSRATGKRFQLIKFVPRDECVLQWLSDENRLMRGAGNTVLRRCGMVPYFYTLEKG